MKILMFAGSLRKESLNKKLLAEIARLPVMKDHEIRIVDLQKSDWPIYDGDVEESSGVPAAARELSKEIADADALIVSSPEYNGSIASSLKTAIDWVSRIKPIAFNAKPMLLFAASPGPLGGTRGLWHTRVPFEVMGTRLYPEMYGLQKAADAFDAEGRLKDEKVRQTVAGLVEKFLDYAGKLRS